MWPTPTTQDAKNNAGPSQWERNTLPLNVEVMMWPTPTAMDSHSSGGKEGKNVTLTDATVRSSRPDDQPESPNGKPGSTRLRVLNPRFVEALMGWPIGWTDCASEVTEWSQWLQRWRSYTFAIAYSDQ